MNAGATEKSARHMANQKRLPTRPTSLAISPRIAITQEPPFKGVNSRFDPAGAALSGQTDVHRRDTRVKQSRV